MLSRAESLCLQLQRTDNLPAAIRELVTWSEPDDASVGTPSASVSREGMAYDSPSGIEELLREQRVIESTSHAINNGNAHGMRDDGAVADNSFITNSDEAFIELKDTTGSIF